MASGSSASSAVMRFQLGRPFGDVSGKDVARAGFLRGRIDRCCRRPLRQETLLAARFVLRKTDSGQFHFNLLATIGRAIATSESYKPKTAALNGIESIKKNARVAPVAATDAQPI